MDRFEYSEEFRRMIVQLHRGMEQMPNYSSYINAHLGEPDSAVVSYANSLCREIEFHCGQLNGKRVLDFGCGTGSSTIALALLSGNVCGYDIDEESIEVARRRALEHGLDRRTRFYCASDIAEIRKELDQFDLILANGVIEHIPLTRNGLRKRIIRTLFSMLKSGGHLCIGNTPNRLWPYDPHSTQLWWIPWTKPGSEWAYNRAVRKGRHSDSPRASKGTLGLEEAGAWGETYWMILEYLEGERFECINLIPGHNRHVSNFGRTNRQTILYGTAEFVVGRPLSKLSGAPMTAFAPYIKNLVLKKY